MKLSSWHPQTDARSLMVSVLSETAAASVLATFCNASGSGWASSLSAAFFIVALDRRHGAAFKSKTISLDRALQAHHRLYVVSQPADDFAR